MHAPQPGTDRPAHYDPWREMEEKRAEVRDALSAAGNPACGLRDLLAQCVKLAKGPVALNSSMATFVGEDTSARSS